MATKGKKPHSPPGFHRGSYPPRHVQKDRNETAFADDELYEKIDEIRKNSKVARQETGKGNKDKTPSKER